MICNVCCCTFGGADDADALGDVFFGLVGDAAAAPLPLPPKLHEPHSSPASRLPARVLNNAGDRSSAP